VEELARGYAAAFRQHHTHPGLPDPSRDDNSTVLTGIKSVKAVGESWWLDEHGLTLLINRGRG